MQAIWMSRPKRVAVLEEEGLYFFINEFGRTYNMAADWRSYVASKQPTPQGQSIVFFIGGRLEVLRLAACQIGLTNCAFVQTDLAQLGSVGQVQS